MPPSLKKVIETIRIQHRCLQYNLYTFTKELKYCKSMSVERTVLWNCVQTLWILTLTFLSEIDLQKLSCHVKRRYFIHLLLLISQEKGSWRLPNCQGLIFYSVLSSGAIQTTKLPLSQNGWFRRRNYLSSKRGDSDDEIISTEQQMTVTERQQWEDGLASLRRSKRLLEWRPLLRSAIICEGRWQSRTLVRAEQIACACVMRREVYDLGQGVYVCMCVKRIDRNSLHSLFTTSSIIELSSY